MATAAIPSPRPPNDRGQGRKKGGLNERTKALRAISDEAIAKGITPIEVMLDNMRFYYEKADVLLTAIVAGVKGEGKSKKPPMELLEMMKEMGSFRDKAQACAVDAGPYVHPRLSATHADVNVNVKVEEAEQAFKTIEHALDSIVTGEIVPKREKAKAHA